MTTKEIEQFIIELRAFETSKAKIQEGELIIDFDLSGRQSGEVERRQELMQKISLLSLSDYERMHEKFLSEFSRMGIVVSFEKPSDFDSDVEINLFFSTVYLAKALLSLNINDGRALSGFLNEFNKIRSWADKNVNVIDRFIWQHSEMALKIVQISSQSIWEDENQYPVFTKMTPECAPEEKLSFLAAKYLHIFKYLLDSLNTDHQTVNKLDYKKTWLVTSVIHWDKLFDDEQEQVKKHLTSEWLLGLTGDYHGSFQSFNCTFSKILPLVSDETAEYFFSHVYVELDYMDRHMEQATHNLNQLFIKMLTQRLGNDVLFRVLQVRSEDSRLTAIDETSGLSALLNKHIEENNRKSTTTSQLPNTPSSPVLSSQKKFPYTDLVLEAIQNYMTECNSMTSRCLHHSGIVSVTTLKQEIDNNPNMTDQVLQQKIHILCESASGKILEHFTPVKELPIVSNVINNTLDK